MLVRQPKLSVDFSLSTLRRLAPIHLGGTIVSSGQRPATLAAIQTLQVNENGKVIVLSWVLRRSRTENTVNVSGENLLGRHSRVSERPELQGIPAYTGTSVTRAKAVKAAKP